MTVAAGVVILASALHMDPTDNIGSALRFVFAHLIWATTFAGGDALQRRDS